MDKRDMINEINNIQEQMKSMRGTLLGIKKKLEKENLTKYNNNLKKICPRANCEYSRCSLSDSEKVDCCPNN